MSEYLQNNEAIVNGKQILELGAGAGLPSIVSAILGATNVVVTDYPDEDLIENLKFNIAENEVYIKSRNVAVNIRAEVRCFYPAGFAIWNIQAGCLEYVDSVN